MMFGTFVKPHNYKALHLMVFRYRFSRNDALG